LWSNAVGYEIIPLLESDDEFTIRAHPDRVGANQTTTPPRSLRSMPVTLPSAGEGSASDEPDRRRPRPSATESK
jgi:hypothetical protein